MTTATAPQAPTKPSENSISALLQEVRMDFSTVRGFEGMQRAATLLASSSMVPEAYRGNMPNCFVALNIATRIGAAPLMIMQNLYVIQGRPSWSSPFLIAGVNSCGRFDPLEFEWTDRGEREPFGAYYNRVKDKS